MLLTLGEQKIIRSEDRFRMHMFYTQVGFLPITQRVKNMTDSSFRGIDKKNDAYDVYQVGLLITQRRQHMANRQEELHRQKMQRDRVAYVAVQVGSFDHTEEATYD